MNKDLQKIMDKRRKLAEARAVGSSRRMAREREQQQQQQQPAQQDHSAALDSSLGDLQESASSVLSPHSSLGGSQSWAEGSKSEMSADLQAVMDRRRRIADREGGGDGGGDNDHDGDDDGGEYPSSPVNAKLKKVGMSSDLKAAMKQRRRAAGSGSADSSEDDDGGGRQVRGEEARGSPLGRASVRGIRRNQAFSSSGDMGDADDAPSSSDEASSSQEEEEEEAEKARGERKDQGQQRRRPPPSRKKTSSSTNIAAEQIEQQGKQRRPTNSRSKSTRSRGGDDDPGTSVHSAGDDASSPQRKPSGKRRPRRASYDGAPRSMESMDSIVDDHSVDPSLDSAGSASKQSIGSPAARSGKKKSSSSDRHTRRSGSGSSGEHDPTSLHSLSRRKTSSGAAGDDDMSSKADSVGSEGRKGSGRRSGRRPRPLSHSSTSASIDSTDSAGKKEKSGSGNKPRSRRPASSRSSSRRGDSPPSHQSSDEGAKAPPKPKRQSSKVSVDEGDFPAASAGAAAKKNSDPFAANWGDTPSFAAGGGDAGFAADFGSTPSEPATGFGAFGDAGFPTATADAAAATTPTFTSSDNQPGFAADFGGGDGGFGAFGSDANPFGSQPQTLFDAPKETVWDKSPLVDMPTKPKSKVSLLYKSTFSVSFLGRPITNPLNGNIIFCSPGRGGATLHEVDPHRDYIQVSSATVLSAELQRRLAAKYNVSAGSLEAVVTLAAGLHQQHGQARLRVAAILDLKVLESQQLMRIVAVWQWGYASPHPNALQFAMTPPSGGEFTYDSSSLQVADGLMFIAGSSPKGPCVFMCKPTVKETWSANFLSGSGRVTSMSVTPNAKRDYPYLAVALSDRSVSVWTYKAALSGTASKANEPSKRWLFPLCRLVAANALVEADASSFRVGDKAGNNDSKDAGHCTQLAWLPPQSSVSSLLAIAVGFQDGMAVFHVSLPATADWSKGVFKALPEPNQSTLLAQTPEISPIAVKRWQGSHERSYISWLTLGAHSNPCVAMLLHSDEEGGGAARLVLCGLRLPLYRRGPWPKERLVPLDLFACLTIPRKSSSFPFGLLHSGGLGSFLCFTQRSIRALSPVRASVQPDPVVASLTHPISSEPPGLTSFGEPLLPDTENDTAGILHIFTVTQCERQKGENNPNFQEWSRPRRRHWLCRTLVGDTKATAGQEEAKEGGQGFGGDDVVTGGAISDVVCELFDEDIDGLTPYRIVRRKGSNLCAVLYRPILATTKSGSPTGFTLDASKIAFIDYSGSAAAFSVVEGRDVAFWTSEEPNSPCGVILSADGSSLTSFSWDSSKRCCKLGSAFRPIVGVDTDENYVECRRVFAFTGPSVVGLVVVGTKHKDGRSCILSGDLCPMADLSLENWSKLLPNIVSGHSLYLDDNEEVFSVIGLEGDDSGYRNFAVATSSRVLIVSSGMEISACAKADVSGGALASMGAFAVAFCSGCKVRYLCCLDGNLACGAIATLPVPMCGYSKMLLTAVRPDRVLVTEFNFGARLVEFGQNANSFLLPTAVTRPALLLEPMVANAICVGGKQDQSSPVLRTVIEKFGRKVASITHGDEEGVGNIGAGLTPKTFEMLQRYGLHQAASYLLTGTVMFDRSANTRILPPWLPIAPKAKAALNCNAFLHVIANGDEYLSEYVKAPDGGVAAALPQPSGPASYICRERARNAIRAGKALDAIKMLDLVGSEASESLILQLSLALGKDSSKDSTGLLKSMCGFDDTGFSRSSDLPKAPAALAALAVTMKQNKSRGSNLEMNDDEIGRWMKPLAPSIQRGARIIRPRQSILGTDNLASAGDKDEDKSDELWVSPCNESKHVWNEGPRKEKNQLLMLDSIEDWLGRQRPVILGKEGASAARDRGEKTLADILNKDDDDSFGGKSDGLESVNDGWVDGVGEGRSDEANLSAYYRMSEGDDEDSPWQSEGLVDLSPFLNKAIVVGDTESFSLQPTTSSVDEGEPGKVKSLYDLVFEKSGDGISSGLAIPAGRGGSLDVGVLHRPEKTTRLKGSFEFWYYLPPRENVPSELVLARRTMGPSADDLSKVCMTSDKGSVLWELVVSSSGELEFRSCSGSSLLSSQRYDPAAAAEAEAAAADDSDDEKKERSDLARFGRWNHVCIVLVSRATESVTKCSASIYMKGEEVASTDLSMQPPGFNENDLDSGGDLDKIMQKSYMVFGLNHGAGFRMTELRVWACERSADDTKSMLYEYLTAAEAKKKFKVKISNKKGGAKLGKLAPGKGMLAAPKGVLGSTMQAGKKTGGLLSLAPAPKGEQNLSLAPPDTKNKEEPAEAKPEAQPTDTTAAGFEASFEAFGGFGEKPAAAAAPGVEEPVAAEELGEQPSYQEEEEYDAPTSLWDTAVPLSQQVRSSAAAAIVRGPPATRHFGGNRGGLPDFSGMDRFGVGGIAICGSEKTIVWRDNEDPPALTYPIGSSGAVVSDLMDDEGSEFLCCFLAKEKRMVVFELQSRTVVVELQMTTKLNFWRFLPPEAAENTLCFMLVTPVGGFHWMPLEESPRPHQVWKRGAELQGKKVVSYEEGGSNGLEGPDILSRVGLVMVTKSSGGGALEAWIVPIDGDSQAGQVSDDVMGACFCQPPFIEDGPFLPLLVTAHQLEEGIYVNVMSVTEPRKSSVQLGEIEVTRVIEDTGFEDLDFEPPTMAMGSFPEAICCSLGNIVVVAVRRKGLIAAFELEDDDLSLIALEGVGHYIVDAVMRYSAEVGGAEIAMLLADTDNPKDGRVVSFCFRSAA